MKVSKLKLNPSNPRQIRAERLELLKKSITEFEKMMVLRPMVVDEQNIVLGGNMRLQAIKALGLKEIPDEWIKRADNLTEAEKKEFVIKDNNSFGEYDFDVIANEWKDLPLHDWGLELPTDWAEVVTETKEEDESLVASTISKAKELQKKWKVKTGDLWQCGNHLLLCGDSTKKEDVERLMQGEKAQMVFTDPPYNALKSWNKDEAKGETRLDPSKWFDNDNMEWHEFEAFLMSVFANFSTHSAYVCCDFRIYPMVKECLEHYGYQTKHCIVWKKNVWGLGKRYRFQHEFIIYACQKDAPFHGDRSQSDVWEEDVDRTTEHNTPKPPSLAKRAMENSTKKGDVVVDFFAGAGSTLIACEQLNRKARCCEISPEYVAVCLERFLNYSGTQPQLLD